MSTPKSFVYVLRSTTDAEKYYVGLTSDVVTRLGAHNAGHCLHTARYKPWEFVASVEFANENSAVRFEKYLKSGSGRAFAKRRFV